MACNFNCLLVAKLFEVMCTKQVLTSQKCCTLRNDNCRLLMVDSDLHTILSRDSVKNISSK